MFSSRQSALSSEAWPSLNSNSQGQVPLAVPAAVPRLGEEMVGMGRNASHTFGTI